MKPKDLLTEKQVKRISIWSILLFIAFFTVLLLALNSCAATQEQLMKPNDRDFKILWKDDNTYYAVDEFGKLVKIDKDNPLYHEFHGYLVCDSTVRNSFERW